MDVTTEGAVEKMGLPKFVKPAGIVLGLLLGDAALGWQLGFELSVILVGAFALLFGFKTIQIGGEILFGTRTKEADNVPFVIWSIWMTGFLYILAGFCFFAGIFVEGAFAFASQLATLITAVTLLVAVGFTAHTLAGGKHKEKTKWALLLRITIWGVFGVLANQLDLNIRLT